ncbi:MAG TPA: hypothetical protein VH459_10555 [Gaiellales bacterium]|jgi:hypothetical protein
MTGRQAYRPPAPRRDPAARAERDALLRRVAAALDSGSVAPEDLERLLSRRASPSEAASRPSPSAVLSTLGAVVVFGGIAIAYGTVFLDMSHAMRMMTPFAFPLAALGVLAGLRLRSAPLWMREIWAYAAYAALTGACLTTGGEANWLGDHVSSAYVIACGALGATFAGCVFRAAPIPRVFAVGLGLALPVLGIGLGRLAGISGAGAVAWLLLGEAGIATAVAVAMQRAGRANWRYPSYWAMLGVWAASVVGVSDAGGEHFSAWHVVLIAAVVAALLAATTLELTPLVWIAGLAGLQWLQMICVVVGSATNSAFAVILAGLGLVVLGMVVRRATERTRPAV